MRPRPDEREACRPYRYRPSFPLFSLHCARVTHSAAVSSRPERVCRCFVIARGKAPPPKEEDGGGEQDQQRVRWYRGDKNGEGEGARVSEWGTISR